MNIINEYRETEIKIKRSQFISHLKEVKELSEAKAFISEISKKHKNANHNCWAYIIGDKGEYAHCSDNGEPSGTAGKPILNTLQKHDLTNVVAVVTRYFGGIKLGVRGLIDAYSEATYSSIAEKPIKPLIKRKKINIQTSYDMLEILKYNLIKLNADITEIDYSEKVNFSIVFDEKLISSIKEFLDKYMDTNKLSYNESL